MPTATAPTAPQPAADTGSTTCKIINNCGNDSKSSPIDIVVGMPVFSSETDNTTPVYSFNKDFELLQVTKGDTTPKTVIKSGDSDTVTLNHTTVDPKTNESFYVRGYNLLICRSPWITPIANLGLTRDLKTKTFADQTVTADNAAAAAQAAAFYQTLQAYPDSQLAQNYMNALSGANTVEKADDFFKNTVSYKLVTLADIVALESNYNYFPFIWVKYGDSAKYFLYSSDGQKTQFQGAFVIGRPAGTAVDITKKNGGYTCVFTPAKNPDDTSTTNVDPSKTVDLTYSDGVFVDDLTTDTPAIALKGTFMLKRTLTKKPDDKEVMVVIAGTINGTRTSGFDEAQLTKKDDKTLDWLKELFDPPTAQGIFQSVMTLLGALMMIHFVGTSIMGISRWIKKKLASGETPTDAEIAAQKAQADAEYKAKIDEIFKKVTGDKAAKTPDTSEAALDTAVEAKGTISTQVSKAQMNDALNTLDTNLQQLETFDSNNTGGQFKTQIDTADNAVGEAYDTLNNPDITDLKNTIEGLRQQMKDMTDTVKNLTDQISQSVGQDMQDQIAENQQEVQQVQEDIENENKTSEEEGSDSTNDDPDSTIIDVDVPAV